MDTNYSKTLEEITVGAYAYQYYLLTAKKNDLHLGKSWYDCNEIKILNVQSFNVRSHVT